MPLNILLADDSVPAQNMGKKILTDAGYHVLAVSNGLEALRKIAETVPDIAILDIFMPGYTGLEICERLRANVATAALPVILTVGKLEPYRSQDGEQVHSNAVIVKPFAAAELISAVRSLIGAPETAADSAPELGVDRHAADAGADPLQESLTDGQPAQNQAGAWQEEVPDEPLFSGGPSATRQDESPLAPLEPTAHVDEPFLSSVELDEPESFLFNPGAKHIPFSASAIDLVASHLAAENDTSGFIEFDLEPVPSHYSAAAEEGFAAVEEPSLAAPAAVADAEPDYRPSPVFVVNTASGEAAELEAPGPSFPCAPALDSLLEVHDASASTVGPSLTILGAGEVSKAIDSVTDGTTVEGGLTRPTAVLVQEQEEEERRRAFEVLFNSTQPFAEESSPIEPAGSSIAILPSMADLSENHPFDVAPDSEIVSLLDNNRSEFIAPEPDPYLMPEGGAGAAIPERDPLLEDGLETRWSEPFGAAQPAESFMEAAGEMDSPQAEEPREMGPSPFDAVAVETQNGAVEARAAEPEIFAPEYSAEVVPASFEAATGQSQFDSELLQTASEVPIAPPQFVSEVLLSIATNPTPEPVMELETEAEPAVMQSESTGRQPEMQSASSPEGSLQSIEAERIRQAVDKVFDRFKRLLVAAIVRELARPD